ncbi:uncharacterized protein LOC126728703 [Quercus robur]|uniref:uncharacterized protein LOC126728703 n=1 Tax=Quercus robur TaxID=38942 RepID=UPI0021632971|nr:uncharacterized protein LOC126728703 [Quercus robur]
MDADFLEKIQKLQLTTEEDETITIRPVRRKEILDEYSLSLVGKFLTKKPINLRAAKNLLRSMWKMGDDLKIVEVGDGLLQFKFTLESQLLWVRNNGPWCFDNHMLAVKRWEKGMTSRSVTFTHLPFWVQVWGLPFDLMTEEAGHDIGRGLGKVIEVDSKAFKADQARFLRIRAEIPLDKPLRRGGPVVSPEGDEVRVAFRYERLVGWCFACGRIGHDQKECSMVGGEDTGNRTYGEWMKAGTRIRADEQRNNQYSPRHRRTEPATQTDHNQNRASPTTPINAETDKPKNKETDTMSPTHTLRTLTQSIPQQLLHDTVQVDANISGNMVNAHSRSTNMETENGDHALYYVPISYGESNASHTPSTKESRATVNEPKTTRTATWKRIPKQGLPKNKTEEEDRVPVGKKRQSETSELDDGQDITTSNKRLKGVAGSTQPTSPTVVAASQPRRSQ